MRASAAALSASVAFSFLISRSMLPATVAMPFCTAASLISTITTSRPATAQAWAMPLPIVPAPTMPTVLIAMSNFLVSLRVSGNEIGTDQAGSFASAAITRSACSLSTAMSCCSRAWPRIGWSA
ncbi:hypothetical protein D3C81_1288890 [compost metagenome]